MLWFYSNLVGICRNDFSIGTEILVDIALLVIKSQQNVLGGPFFLRQGVDLQRIINYSKDCLEG